jgi:leucyl-tRNA synthetase
MAERHVYDPAAIEPRWQRVWEERRAFRTPDDPAVLAARPKYYILDMFPYPSGAGLHVGHPEGYTATDVVARLRRMQGYNVLHPMGWDAFGLPAERAAVREGMHPAEITRRNIATFRRQIRRLGFSYDWDRELSTADPAYYRWTQWIFLKLYERGLAYMAEVPVNWCPALGTVLANEEVKDGRYVETGDPVERRLMRQWMLKITAYAERLLADLDLVEWPEHVKEMQRHWIGRSEGAEIDFEVAGGAHRFTVFTTRPDTLFGCTFCVLAPEHHLVREITTPERRQAVEEYVRASVARDEAERADAGQEKHGVFTGAFAIHPVTGSPLQIWVGDYVLMAYGTGAIMGVPGQDQRDWDFAERNSLPIVRTVEPPADFDGKAYLGDGPAIASEFLDGLAIELAKERMIEWLEEHGKGRRHVEYKLRDWLFSRQRYWGEPFPILHAEDGSIIPLPEQLLPVELPLIDEYRPTDDGRPPLARAPESWLSVTLPDGRAGLRETNTMPQWAGSCWYYLRYLDPNNDRELVSSDIERYWMPVDLYVGGVEHAVLHLLYARFWHKVLYDCGLVSTPEPFQRLFNQGMILAYSYQDARGKYYDARQVLERDGRFFAGDVELAAQVEKMSKSKLNVFSPDEIIDEYGADAMRLYELFMGPLDAQKPWQMAGVEGVRRFLERVWRLAVDERTGELAARLTDAPAASEPELHRLLHKTIRKVLGDTETLAMNTAISQMMVFVNAATQAASLPRETLATFLRVLAPYAPHLAEELWHRLGHDDLIAQAPWPAHDEALCADELVTVIVQVNGKKRDEILVPREATREELEGLALASDGARRHLEGRTPKKVVVVPGRLVNLVV